MLMRSGRTTSGRWYVVQRSRPRPNAKFLYLNRANSARTYEMGCCRRVPPLIRTRCPSALAGLLDAPRESLPGRRPADARRQAYGGADASALRRLEVATGYECVLASSVSFSGRCGPNNPPLHPLSSARTIVTVLFQAPRLLARLA